MTLLPRPLRHYFRSSLQSQILLALLTATAVATFLAGEIVRRAETRYLEESFETHSRRTFSMLTAACLDAVISEDRPVLETVVQQTVAQDPAIREIYVSNADGIRLIGWLHPEFHRDAAALSYSRPIVLEGESFGSLGITWDTSERQAAIDAHVRSMRLLTAAGLLFLTLLTGLLLHRVAIRPVQAITDRLQRLSAGDLSSQIHLTAARELESLARAVNELAEEIQRSRRREKELLGAKRSLARARDTALESVRLKSEFLSTVSHELRTPLNGIFGMLQLLEDADLNEEERSFLRTAISSGEMLLTIINDILDFSKVESGKLRLEKTEFDVRELVEEIATLMAESARAKGTDLSAFVTEDLPSQVRGDPTRLRQIIANLLGNATKFTHEGEISMRVETRPATLRGAIDLEVSVRDTGIGIPEDRQASIFSPFTQADGSTTRKYGGTGLGLAICKTLVELMGGRIWVESRVGEGSTFRFTVPLESVEARDPEEGRALRSSRALLVARRTTHRSVVEDYLRSWGVKAFSCDSGAAALSAIEPEGKPAPRFDVVILDRRLADGDGLSFAVHHRSHSALSGVPFLMMTDGPLATEVAEGAGISAILKKPIRRSVLLDALSELATTPAASAPDPASATRPSRAESRAPPSPPAASLSGHILLVEDNPTNQLVARRLLEKLGLEVEAVENGRKAVDARFSAPYDLIFMDAQMPVLDGYAATREIRDREAAERHPRLPVVAMTANALEGDREKCLAAGMDDYLAKPIDLPCLQSTLRRWLSGEETDESGSTVLEVNAAEVLSVATDDHD